MQSEFETKGGHSRRMMLMAPSPIFLLVLLSTTAPFITQAVALHPHQIASSFITDFISNRVHFMYNNSNSNNNNNNNKNKNKNSTSASSPSLARVIWRRIVVDKYRGRGHYSRIQDAIDSVPEFNSRWVHIRINAGVYWEKVSIPYNKPFVLLEGAGMDYTVITWSDSAISTGTADSATFSVCASNFVARGISFRNDAPPPSPGAQGRQAVAVLLSGDRMAFYQCGFYGAQDTLFDYEGRHYFKDCYIEGSIDFIFGHGQSTYKGCRIYVKAQPGYISGSITAHNRNRPQEGSGFVFLSCSIMGTGQVFLGRAWGAYSRVLFLYTYMSNIILPQGWYDWGIPSRQRSVYYGQYKCTGPGSNRAGRVWWSHELSDAEAWPFLQLSYINGGNWLREI